MIQLPVWDLRDQIGLLQIQERGLYVAFTAELPMRQKPTRLWLVGESALRLLTTPVPEGSTMRCRRTLAKGEVPAGLVGALCLVEKPGIWQSWEAGLIRLEGTAVQYALRCSGEPIPFLSEYPRLTTCMIENELYLVLPYSLSDWLENNRKPGIL